MKKSKITRISLSDARVGRGKTNWAAVDKLTDADIEAAIASDPDAAPILDAEWFRNATLVLPEPKQMISLRVDADVLTWFRNKGRGWQTQVNAILRKYAAAHGAELGESAMRAPPAPAAKSGRKQVTRAGSIRLKKPSK
ncbi:BrnA antitoxin family protein [Roseiterribacter gracilis]